MPIWKIAMDTAVSIFDLTEVLPKKEDYGLTSQIRRSALSISANIAEAFGREHKADKINFYYYARGSVTETKNHLEYGKRTNYFRSESVDKIDSLLDEIHKGINKIIVTLKNS